MTALPRFANPHHLAQSTEIASRSAIYPVFEEGEQEIDTSLLTDLTALVKQDLGDITIVSRRRRKLKHRAETDAISEEHIVAYRLLSTSLPPQNICLDVKPPPKIIYWEPPCEDDESEAEVRKRHATAAAVDFTWLSRESHKVSVARPNEQRKDLHASGSISSSSPPILLVEWPAKRCSKVTTLQQLAGPAALPSPHDPSLSGHYCTAVSVKSSDTRAEPRKASKKKKKSVKERPPPRFWRPVSSWGGKSMGYAMGYEGSWAVDDEESQNMGYDRDTMKKGIPVSMMY